MEIETFFDPATYTLTYVVFNAQTRDAVVIDPVLDYDPLSSKTSTTSLAKVEQFIKQKELRLHAVLETHAHADHLSGSLYLKKRFEAQVVIGARIKEVQETFHAVFNLSNTVPTDGSQFDRLVHEGDVIVAGGLKVDVLETPGHTPACVSYKIEDAVFTGDALFMEDYGTGRCDFPKGDANAMYHSVHDKLYQLPDSTRVFVGHDYQPGGRELKFETTIGRSKASNIQLKESTSQQEFVLFRNKRDAGLEAPRLLFPSIQININAGRLPEANDNNQRYLVIPLNMNTPTEDDGTPKR
jgi:glyoxylase-like metal-dependent hydrolase (beta-lactamase superfamily II)